MRSLRCFNENSNVCVRTYVLINFTAKFCLFIKCPFSSVHIKYRTHKIACWLEKKYDQFSFFLIICHTAIVLSHSRFLFFLFSIMSFCSKWKVNMAGRSNLIRNLWPFFSSISLSIKIIYYFDSKKQLKPYFAIDGSFIEVEEQKKITNRPKTHDKTSANKPIDETISHSFRNKVVEWDHKRLERMRENERANNKMNSITKIPYCIDCILWGMLRTIANIVVCILYMCIMCINHNIHNSFEMINNLRCYCCCRCWYFCYIYSIYACNF